MRILLTGVLEDGTPRREGVPIDPRANVSITKGANVEIVVTVVTPGGEPVKLTGTGTELLLTVKKRPTEAATISRLAVSEGNVGTFTLVPTDTRTQIAGLYGYDVWLTKDGERDVVVPLSPFNLLEANAAIPADGTLPPVPPSGNLVGGPGSSTDSAVALWDGGDGDLLKNSVITVDNAGNITTPGNISATQLQGNAVNAAAPSASDVLTWDGSAWAPAAGGGVSGPGSSTDNAVPRWDGTGGDALLDSVITITDAGRLQFGGVTSSFPALQRSGTGLEVRNAAGTDFVALRCSTFVASNISASSFIEAGAASGIRWLSRSKISAPVNGNIRFTDTAGIDFGLHQYGGITSSFPAWKRSGAEIHARLADDSDFANLGAALITGNSDSIIVMTPKTPASASDTGTTGQIAWDSNFIYVAVATNTWKRVAISTF